MFQDVDQTLRAVLVADVPIKKGEVDLAFDRPNRDWSSRLSKPTLNLFLFDVRERADLKDDVPIVTRDGKGRAVKQRPPRRLDLSYLVSAWTTEPDDEHRILARVLASMYRQELISPEVLQGDLKAATLPVMARVPAPDDVYKPHDLWGALSNDLHASLTWIWTVPLDVFKSEVGPLVRTAEVRVRPTGEPLDVKLVKVGGMVRRKGDRLAGVAGTRLEVIGTAHRVETGVDGRFNFDNVPAGEYQWRIEPPGGKARLQTVVVPSPDYDIDV